MKHLDLFSGIGGFALAVDTVWPNSTHTFCEIDPFCQKILAKHWPQSKIYADIRTFTNSQQSGLEGQAEGSKEREEYIGHFGGSLRSGFKPSHRVDILTGGFPCQPFSQAGLRRGTSDNRFLWGEMLRVIQEFQPTWVIAENVRGLLTIEQGMVFEQVCLDLEASGYEVQPFIIPAVSVNAPHRRDRVWFVANRNDSGSGASRSEVLAHRTQDSEEWQHSLAWTGRQSDWDENWIEVATELCSVDDGLPVELDGFKLSKSRHRAEQLKAYGNAIVPQVAIQIMQAINYKYPLIT